MPQRDQAMREVVGVADERALAACSRNDADDDQVIQRQRASTSSGATTAYHPAPKSAPVGRKVVRTVNTPSKKPTTNDPASPIKIVAGGKLKQRKPSNAPSSRASRRGDKPLPDRDRRDEERRRADRRHARGQAVHVVQKRSNT